ncbi:ABC transporter permease [Novosphingobium album (ex Liu et al. 2023)]|uniref:ABC transporter permease n=1 Tax=Novosphingobium album (ex Liu et al. 2023) TaxID=3031130 RepID=A0ABT5WXJ2_9SPHN|nr:ABC transporter permease [Novosphingobium album (ex Liu et al. 2023)]MDE8654604.1 ABC transporter permease [Novosphingobium album (ex Liu et al. 2023)]
MIAYLFRRIGLALAILVVTVSLLFCVIHAVPGDPASVALGPRATAAMKAEFRAEMGLDRPVFVQFFMFVGRVMTGDLGTDVLTRQPVARLVLDVLPNTMVLAFASILWAVVAAIGLGLWCGLYPNGWADRLIGVISTSIIAVPTFVVAIYSLLIFAVQLRWFPAIGAGKSGDPLSYIHHLILPSFAVGLGWVGYLARIIRAAMLDVMSENHVRTYRAFGVSDTRIALRFVLPIVIVPVISVLGVGLGTLLSGAVLTEIVFDRPGLGRLAYDAVISRNYPVVTGTVVVTASLYLFCNLVADLCLARLSPDARAKL